MLCYAGIPRAYPAILNFLERVASTPGYEEPVMDDDDEDEGKKKVSDSWNWDEIEENGDKEVVQETYFSPLIRQALAKEAMAEEAARA